MADNNAFQSLPTTTNPPTGGGAFMTDNGEQPQRKLLHIHPLVLYFPPPLNRIITNILTLQNTSKTHYVAYKVKTTRPNRYCVRPNLGLISPGETIELQIHFSFQKDPPESLNSKDKFQVESILLTTPLSSNEQGTAHLAELFKKTPKEEIMREKLKCRFASRTPVAKPKPEPTKIMPVPTSMATKLQEQVKAPSSAELREVAMERDKLKLKVREMQSKLEGAMPPLGRELLIVQIVFLIGFLLGYLQFFYLGVLLIVALFGGLFYATDSFKKLIKLKPH